MGSTLHFQTFSNDQIHTLIPYISSALFVTNPPIRGYINAVPYKGLFSASPLQRLGDALQDVQSLPKGRAQRPRRSEAGEEMPRNGESQKHTGSLKKENKASISYTDKDQETLRRGLRILARLIVRTQMRRQLSRRQAESERKDKDHAL